VHFHAENGGILYWVHKYKVNELPIYARKSGGSKRIAWTRTQKSGGQLTPLTPCFRGLFASFYEACVVFDNFKHQI